MLNNLIPKYHVCTQTTCNSMTFYLKNKGQKYYTYLYIAHNTDGLLNALFSKITV